MTAIPVADIQKVAQFCAKDQVDSLRQMVPVMIPSDQSV